MKNILLFRYATELSENYFTLYLHPKNLSIKLEKELKTPLFDNFSILIKSDSTFHRESLSKVPTFISKKYNKYSTISSHVIFLTEYAIKFINSFLIKDFYNTKKKNNNKNVVFQTDVIKKLWNPKFNTRRKTYKKTNRKSSNANLKYDFLNKYGNNVSQKSSNLNKCDKPIFKKFFYHRDLNKQ